MSRLPGFVALAAACIVLCSPGCQHPNRGPADSKQMVSVGTTKADLFGVPAEYRALHAGMEKALGKPVWFNSQKDAACIQVQLEQGNVPFAILSAGEYAAISDPSKLKLLASGVNSLGRTSRKALVVCRASDERFKTISDCADKRFAFGTYGDLLTDYAARHALQQNGVPLNKLFPELLPPPFAMEGRLYVQKDAATKILLDATVNAGVIDEVVFERLPAAGGNPITGPSKDQFRVIGETMSVPEVLVVAGPSADPELVQRMSTFLLEGVKGDAAVREQMGIIGFAAPDPAACETARFLARQGKS